MLNTIAPGAGAGIIVKKGERLKVICPEGHQVSDMFCFSESDYGESLSSSVSVDRAEKIFLSAGDVLVSNRGNVMLKILGDTHGRSDFLLPPCRESENGHTGCFENLSSTFLAYGISADRVGTAFNIFMNVEVSAEGRLVIHPSEARSGDYVEFEAQMDLVVGLTACAHLLTNGGSLRPIQWEILPQNA